MSRTRERSKGRKGYETEPFAMIPQSVLQHETLSSAPHAAFRILAILLMGKPKERNGTMACTESYAARYGITSRDTVRQSIRALEERGLIERTRRVAPFSRYPTLWAVTWWPIYNRDGQPLDSPELPTHAYRNWKPSPPEPGSGDLIRSHRPPGGITTVSGVVSPSHHTDGRTNSPVHHTGGRGYSKTLTAGFRAQGREDAASAAELDRKILHLHHVQPHLTDRELAKTLNTDSMRVSKALEAEVAA